MKNTIVAIAGGSGLYLRSGRRRHSFSKAAVFAALAAGSFAACSRTDDSSRSKEAATTPAVAQPTSASYEKSADRLEIESEAADAARQITAENADAELKKLEQEIEADDERDR